MFAKPFPFKTCFELNDPQSNSNLVLDIICVVPLSFRKYSFSPDINECAVDNGGCSQICINTHGSFECACEVGFVLAANDSDCDGED